MVLHLPIGPLKPVLGTSPLADVLAPGPSGPVTIYLYIMGGWGVGGGGGEYVCMSVFVVFVNSDHCRCIAHKMRSHFKVIMLVSV